MIYQVCQLKRTFQQGDSSICALNNISFTVEDGEYLAVTGPSGSGKTTLLNILALLDTDFSGTLSLQGKNMHGRSPNELAHLRLAEIGMIFQRFYLLPSLNVVDNVALPYWRLHKNQAAARKKAKTILSELGLKDRFFHRVNRLSAGEMQRVAIARALINDPKVLLADEPTGNLDAQNTLAILGIFSKIVKEGKTIIVISHDPDLLNAPRRVLHLRFGMLEPKASP